MGREGQGRAAGQAGLCAVGWRITAEAAAVARQESAMGAPDSTHRTGEVLGSWGRDWDGLWPLARATMVARV